MKNHQVGALGLDVYEQEEAIFFKEVEFKQFSDWDIEQLISFQNSIVTGHQAFFTKEAITKIAETTVDNILAMQEGTCKNLISQ